MMKAFTISNAGYRK